MGRDTVIDAEETERRGRAAAGCDPVKRNQILEGARQVFMDMGFDAASMNDITRAAGVSKGTIYVYFANKEELFDALIEEERKKIFNNLYGALDPDEPPEKALFTLAIGLARKILSDDVLSAQRTVIGICERMPEMGRRFYERGPKMGHARLTDYLTVLSKRGVLALPDPALAAYQFMDLATAGLYRQCLFHYRNETPSDAEMTRTAQSAVTLFLTAYRA